MLLATRRVPMQCLWLCCLLLTSLSVFTNGQERERPQFVFGDAATLATCVIQIAGTEATERAEAKVAANVVCNGDTLYDEELTLSEIEEQSLDHGIKLFSKTAFGMAYVYLDASSEANLVNSTFSALPEIGTGGMAAPLVAIDATSDITNTTFEDNRAGYATGGVLIAGSSNVEFLRVTFRLNEGKEGVLHVTEKSRTDIDECYFGGNRGTQVGAIKISEDSVARISDCVLEENFGKQLANEIYVTDVATCFMDGSSVYGQEVESDFDDFIRDSSRPDNDADGFDIPSAAVAAVDKKSTVLFADSVFSGHAGRFGAIYVTDSPIFSALRTRFVGNRAVTGGGLFVNSARTGFVRVLECNFTGNTARNGGGLVMAGNGTYTIDESHFENNTAINGGAIWGDYSKSNRCPRASTGSRVTILASTFVKNSAQKSGGGFFIQCTNLYAENSVFHENTAMDGDGGFLHASRTLDLFFRNCSFAQNSASGNGGALYVDQSNDIVSNNCSWMDNKSGKDGGSIVSLNGHGIVFRNSQLHNSASGRHGGGIFATNLTMIDFTKSSTILNEAKGRGGVISGTNVEEFLWNDVTTERNKGSSSGAIQINGGKVFELKQMQFLNHEAKEQDAGAIQLQDVRNITIENVDFLRNTAAKACGALSIENAAHLKMLNSLLKLNVGQRGGGLCVDGADSVSLTALQFQSNLAEKGDGGGLHLRGAKSLSMRNLTFTENKASQSGGAVSVDRSAKVEMSDTVMESNLAEAGDGGALILTEGESLSMSNLKFIKNNASESGGALALADLRSASITATKIMNSTAPVSGGCLSADSVTKMSLKNSFLSHCESGDGGAAIFTGLSQVTGQDMIFELNSARDGGGAFLCRQQTTVNIDESRFYHNAAPDGSTLNADCSCKVDIRDSRIYRDEDRSNNGDFFERNDLCTELVALRNDFFGGPEANTDLEWYEWTGVFGGIAVALLLLCCCFFVRRRKKKAAAATKKKATSDIENQASDKDEEEYDEDEETEEDSEEESEAEESGNEKESAGLGKGKKHRRRRRGKE